MTYWIDVEDLFEYALVNRRPSGIQRLSFELYRALVALRPQEIAFCRHDRLRDTLRTVSWAEVESLFAGLTGHGQASGASVREAPRPVGQAGRVRRIASRLPADIRVPLGEAVRAQMCALRAGLRAGRGVWQAGRRLRRPPPQAHPQAGAAVAGQDLVEAARPGDMLLVLGSPWFRTDYADLLQRMRQRTGLGVAMLVYDLIPLIRPEFCDAGLVRTFRAWFTSTMPQVDRFMAISRATARDLERYAQAAGITLAHPVAVLPIGTGFGEAASVAPVASPRVAALPPHYVLLVSTIEARKNHLLAFRAWRRLVDQLPAEQMPTLVFAGRVGWMVMDLMQQLENCGWLGGKVVLIEDPSDEELAALYAGCQFTLFPSHYEGWGLPVTESLGFGKICVASSATSIPEAGGPFCLYHDPEDVPEAVAILRRLIGHPAELEIMEARLQKGFQHVPWVRTAESMLQALE
ncbi:glycosyltransferase family 4 protein [Roseomonas marmotae]|uniref:Glycosyltransferase family 4 protein n=1 Tax=Roseomonas marmotae TaxID=2768161 RepID=A0ABS3KC02_9PROT|nr:glycosyltransferase family 1 protein [Roseomonas marmotae]MBO1074974.1 glycosyltransferase family 4 protein [Roseomonas marmotae]QTI79986.1 glycosyltransferase family 4 protein [Roseomonas marmotae]